jgi:uncharacterized protein YjbI with pentapeptide repeats
MKEAPSKHSTTPAELLGWREADTSCSPEPALLVQRLRAGYPVELPIDLSGAQLIEEDLSGLDLTGACFRGAELGRAKLCDAILTGADLSGASLCDADLSGAELSGVDLSQANLDSARLRCAVLSKANLSGATLTNAKLQGATLTEADFSGADLRFSCLSDVRARDANFSNVDLTRAKLFQADLEGAQVLSAVMDYVCLRGANVSNLSGYKKASWIGVDLREIDFTGAHLFRNFVLDQNYIEEFRTQSRWTGILYHLWRITSDCGRSIKRWAFWTAAIVVMYAFLFSLVEIDYGDYPTNLSALYFSVVTLTTLGHGDVLPMTALGQVIVMVEVVTGYVMLGGLLTILSHKMASRSH